MRCQKVVICFFCLLFIISSAPVFAENNREIAKVEVCADVFRQFVAMPDNAPPKALLNNALAIAIIPGIIKAGFIAGGRYGWGVMMCRKDDGNWSNPVFVNVGGGSFGFQAGVQSIDAIMVFKSRKSVDRLAQGKFTLGADAAVAAGPVGRNVSAGTDIRLEAEVYTYSRARGLFAGVSFTGSVLAIDYAATDDFYGASGLTAGDIFAGKANLKKVPPVTGHLLQIIDQYTK